MNKVRDDINILENHLDNLRKDNVTDPFDLEMKIIDLMPDFYDNYPSIVKRLCKAPNQDNSYLYKMLDLLDEVDKGEKTLSSVELKLGEELANKFIYPVVKELEKNK
jgi:hypothetical protein